MSPWHMQLRCLDLVAAFLLGVSSAVGTRPRLCWHALACLSDPPSMRGCSAYELCSILPLNTCLRLILFCTCPPLCAGALWPMPAWVWRDVRSVFDFFLLFPIESVQFHDASVPMWYRIHMLLSRLMQLATVCVSPRDCDYSIHCSSFPSTDELISIPARSQATDAVTHTIAPHILHTGPSCARCTPSRHIYPPTNYYVVSPLYPADPPCCQHSND